jgi:ABC-2 type transport system ATP-binding protein
VLAELAVGEVQVDEHSRKLTAPVTGGTGVLMAALGRLDANGIALLDFGLRRPTLDDVFLTLTGHAAEPTAAASADHPQPDAEPGAGRTRDQEPAR